MLGWKLFVRALTLITDNLVAAMRISLLPYGLAVASGLWVASSYPEWVGAPLDPEAPPPADFLLASMGSLLLGVLASLWISVGWHRFALLGEAPAGWVPPFDAPRLLRYFGRTVLAFLLAFLAAITVVTMLTVLLVPLFGASVSALPATVGFFVACLVFYRVGIMLPAGATGHDMKLNEALVATRGQAQTIIILAVLTVGVTVLLRLPTVVEDTGAIVSTLYQFVTGWIALMLGVGTLTALYGHLVEGRPVE